MSSEVKRYNHEGDYCGPQCGHVENSDGDWVRATDYAALEAENARLREEISQRVDTSVQLVGVRLELDAGLAQLAAIQGGMGDVVEVSRWPLKRAHDFLYSHDEVVDAKDHDRLIAQHQRITAAMAAELEKFKQANRELSESNVRRRDSELKMRAELEAARKQSPIGHVALGSHTGVVFYSHMPQLPDGTKLYALPPLAGRVAVPRELLERAAYLMDLGELDGPTTRELRALLAGQQPGLESHEPEKL